MSRKSRLKKKNKQKLQKRFDQVTPEAEESSDAPLEQLEVGVPTESVGKIAAKESDSIIDEPTRKLISKDVRMIIFTLIGLALILVAVRILEIKTDYITTFGNWLYKITNIQTM